VCMYYCRPPTAKTQCPNFACVCRNICMCVHSVAKGKNTEVCESERATIPTIPTLPTLPPWARTDTAMVSRWEARVRVPSNKHRVHMCMSSPRASPKCVQAMIIITILARSSSKPLALGIPSRLSSLYLYTHTLVYAQMHTHTRAHTHIYTHAYAHEHVRRESSCDMLQHDSAAPKKSSQQPEAVQKYQHPPSQEL